MNQQVYALEGHGDTVPALALSADGATLYSGSWDNHVRLWDTRRGVCTHQLESSTIQPASRPAYS